MYGSRRIKNKAYAWSFFLCILVSMPATSVENKEKQDLAAYKEISQMRLDSARDLLQKDIQALTVRVDAQDKRLDAQNSHIDQGLSILGTLLSYLGIVLALAGLAGYFSVQNKAKKEAQREAQREAKATTNEWFQRSSADVQARISALQSKLDSLEAQAEKDFSSHMQQLTEKQALADLAMKNIQQSIDDANSLSKVIPEGEAQALSEAAQATKNKPESQYTYIDWNYRAFDALRNGDKENAVQYWRAAARSVPVPPEVRCQALYNAGATLANLTRHDDAIVMYDEVLKDFWESNDSYIELTVAQALNGKIVSLGIQKRYEEALSNIDLFFGRFAQSERDDLQVEIRTALYHKAVTFEQMGRNDDCLGVYDEIINRYDHNESQQAKEWVVSAYTTKGMILRKVGRLEESEAILDSVINKYSDDESEVLRKEAGKAMNSKGYRLLCNAKESWSNLELRINILEMAFSIFLKANIVYPGNAYILGNLAYNSHLLSRPVAEVMGYLNEALRIGEERLYEETINDLDFHPLGETDDTFRALLESTWGAMKKTARV